jgi:phosphatidylinositol-3-phosphatase
VGALLLSRYVKAGSSDAVDTFNQFSLLKTIEDLFSLRHLGYSSDAAVPEFDSAIFNAYQG